MVQTLPQVRVFQEFTLAPTAITQPLRAFIFGPHFNVRSYDKAKSQIGLGAYDPDSDQEYLWPGILPGETVDQAFTRVFVDDALIRFYLASAGGVGFDPVNPNKLVMGGSFGWATNASAARLAAILKDVEIGDYVRLTNPGDANDTFLTSVRGIDRAVVASSHDTNPTVDADNAATPGSPGSETYISAPGGSGFTLTADASSYKGYIQGLMTERYTLRVTVAGALGVARMNVLSASGLDDELDVLIPGAATPVGALGLEVSFAGAGSFAVGEEWVVDVVSAFAATAGSAITVAGTYTGPSDAVYIIEITEGGDVGVDTPKFRVTTDNGIDNSGVLDASATATAVGAYGLTIAFTASDQLAKGDRFTFDATAAAQGRASTLVLANSIPATLIALSDVDVELMTKRNIELTSEQANTNGVYNWTQDSTTVELKAGATYYAEGDVLSGQPVRGGSLYASYRALSTSWSNTIQTISDVAQLNSYFSDLTPENPLGFAVKAALTNANGTDVKFLAVRSDNLAGYIAALEKTLEREDVYSFVPLSTDRSVLNTVQAHVLQQSSPEKGRWRIAWVSGVVPTLKALVGSTSLVKATITAYPDDPAGLYRLVTASGADFQTNGVRAGDTLRFAYTNDAFGDPVYSTDTIFSVISEDQVLVETGLSSPVNTASKIEVWRTLTTDDQVSELTDDNTYASRRVYNVLAGGATMDGFEGVADYFVAAAYAGLRSAVLPHQGLTNVQLAGVDDVPFTFQTLSGSQLDTLMNAGFWLVVKDPANGDIYCRKQISTDLTDINTTEQSVTTNLDSQSYVYKTTLAPYIGRTNNVLSVQQLIRADIEAAFQVFFNAATPTLGSQILEGTEISEIRPHATLPDRLVVRIATVIPYPLNNLDLYLVV